MKKDIFLVIIFVALIPFISRAEDQFAHKLAGRILLQVEKNGEAWYVHPKTLSRYYAGTPKDAFTLMTNLGVGISNADFAKLQQGESKLIERLLGYIVLQVEKNGEAWYVDPFTEKPIPLRRPFDAWRIMRERGVGITDKDLARIPLYDESKSKGKYMRGLYLTAYSAGNSEKRKEIRALIKKTELNAVVIDIKDASGYVLYDSALPDVQTLSAKHVRIPNLKNVMREFKQDGIYVIARQVVFQDPILASRKSDWAIKKTDGSIWKDYKGQAWVDPQRKEVWDYTVAIAKEVAELGAEEINFDYVRFPSDGPLQSLGYVNTSTTRTTTMKRFFEYVSDNLKGDGHVVSVDFFGLTLDNAETGYDLGIGQRLIDAAPYADYIYPMTYPSHYAPYYLGFENPALYPYEVVRYGLTKSQKVLQNKKARLRIWIQAFDLGAVYDGEKIRAQITAAEESEFTDGWILWNPRNVYSGSGLKEER